jgi:hypothetical protein
MQSVKLRSNSDSFTNRNYLVNCNNAGFSKRLQVITLTYSLVILRTRLDRGFLHKGSQVHLGLFRLYVKKSRFPAQIYLRSR